MTTASKGIIFGSAGAILIYLAAKARTVGNLIFLPGTVTGMSFNALAPEITFTVFVQNTSALGVQVDSFAGNLVSDGTYIGNVYNFLPVVIPPNSQTAVQITARLQPLGLVNEIIQAFQYKNFSRNIKIQGFVNAGILQIPLTLNFSIGGN